MPVQIIAEHCFISCKETHRYPCPKCGEELFYSMLTPGIRDLVRELRNAGFETCDSGDGVTNPELGMEGAMGERHVFMATTLEAMVEDTQRLAEMYPDAWVELSWSPSQDPNIMLLPDGLVIPPGVGIAEEPDKVVLTTAEQALVDLYTDETP